MLLVEMKEATVMGTSLDRLMTAMDKYCEGQGITYYVDCDKFGLVVLKSDVIVDTVRIQEQTIIIGGDGGASTAQVFAKRG